MQLGDNTTHMLFYMFYLVGYTFLQLVWQALVDLSTITHSTYGQDTRFNTQTRGYTFLQLVWQALVDLSTR